MPVYLLCDPVAEICWCLGTMYKAPGPHSGSGETTTEEDAEGASPLVPNGMWHFGGSRRLLSTSMFSGRWAPSWIDQEQNGPDI